jgi:hypothetical protein
LVPTSNISIEPQGEGRWRIRAVRELGGASAEGEVVVKGSKSSVLVEVPHEVLAGSKAWLSLGEARFDEGDLDGTITCVRKGLDELGDSYRSREVTDDSSLSILMAEDKIQQGRADSGARQLLDALRGRIDQYERLHKETIEKSK